MDLRAREQAMLRLMILQLVAQPESRRTSEHVLSLALRDMALEQPADVLRAELDQLQRLGAVVVTKHSAEHWMVELTERGDQAQRGVIELSGVERPRLRS